MKTKILISPGYGAGYSTWSSGSQKFIKFLLTYKPFIDCLESGNKITKEMIKTLKKDVDKLFPESSHVCDLGIDHLIVKEVNGPFVVDDYDGFEAVDYGVRDFIDFEKDDED